MAARTGVQKLSLLKRGWHEVPDLMCSLGIGAVDAPAGLELFAEIVTNTSRYEHKPSAMAFRYFRPCAEYTVWANNYTVIRDTDVTDPKKLGDIYN